MNMIDKKQDHQQITVGKWTISEKLGIIKSPEEKSYILEPRLSSLLFLLAQNDIKTPFS